MKKRILALTLALSLLLSSCAGRKDTAAASMHLRRTEGTVSVSDGSGKDVPLLDNLGLYSGYGVGTQSVSYAWIDLDDVKLAKLDQKSEISIEKEGKALNIELKTGSLFFNVTKPLEADETMNIRTSTMLVGIRGTCGWVVSNGGRGAQVFILEGTVEAEAAGTGETVRVTAGSMAEVTVNGNGETTITVQPFVEEHIAPFVLTELENDAALSAAILEASGLDILNPPDPAERLRAEYIDIINSQPILDEYAYDGAVYRANGLTYASEGLSYAAIVDFDGDGTDELFLVTQYGPWSLTKLEVYGDSQGHAALYGEADLAKFGAEYGWADGHAPSHFNLAERNGQIYAIVTYGVQAYEGSLVYTVENNELTLVKRTGYDGYVDEYTVNWDLTSNQNICPPLPDDARMKTAVSSCLDTYASPEYYCFAKWVNKDLYRLDIDGTLEKYSWNGTEIDRTVLEDNIIYAKLIDMDQDGAEELIVIMEDYSSVAYSWKGTSCERILLHEKAFDYSGFYRDTVTRDIYLYSADWVLVGKGMEVTFDSLTDHLDYSFYTAGVVEEHFGRSYDELTPAEREEANIMTAKIQEEFQRSIDRFVLIEDINLSGNRFESFEQLRYTVDEARQQLMER